MASSTDQSVQAGYWVCQSNFQPENIKSNLFTHLFAAFADINPATYQVTFPEGFVNQFQQFTVDVRRQNPDVKTLLSIGGGDTDPSIFAKMTSQGAYLQAFITSSLELAKSNNFDGLSIEWQYPYTSQEMNQLGELLTKLREKAGEELLLTAAVFYSPEYPSSLKYPFEAIIKKLNWINIMAYDMYTPDCASKLTGPPAPLYNPTIPTLSVDSGVKNWVTAQVPAKKLVLGLPYHGRSWLLVNRDNKKLFSPAKGRAENDPIPYRRIASMNPAPQPVVVNSYVTEYSSTGTTWFDYDGTNIISTKVKYAKETKGLLGYFAWHVANDTDDWTLSTKAYNAWNGK